MDQMIDILENMEYQIETEMGSTLNTIRLETNGKLLCLIVIYTAMLNQNALTFIKESVEERDFGEHGL